MTQTAVEIHDNYEAHPGNSNYSLRVEFDIEKGCVDIYDFFGNGQTMRSFHGLSRHLVASNQKCEYANVDAIKEFLESDGGQLLLANVQAGFTSEWDGSNHVGRLTEDATDALESLQDAMEDMWEQLPTLWSADDWYGGASITGEAVVDLIEPYGDIDTAVNSEVAEALPDHHLDENDVEKYFRHELEKVAEDTDDLDLCNRARVLLDDSHEWPLMTTIRAEFERQDRPDGVCFTEYEVDGVEVTLVNDRYQCWIAATEELEEALDEVRPAFPPAEDSEGCDWYSALCNKVSHREDLEEAFESEHGQRNWP